MEVTVQLSCRKCNRASRIRVNTDNVGQMYNGYCSGCGAQIRFLISEDLVRKLEAAMKQRTESVSPPDLPPLSRHASRDVSNFACAYAPPPASYEQKGVAGDSLKNGKDETFVPSSRPNSGRNSFSKDETFVPGRVSVKSRTLVLTTTPSEETHSQTFSCDQPFMVVGKKNNAGPLRRPDVEVVSQDPYMSKKHFLIRKMSDKDFAIEDYNSTNGTWLNGKKLDPGESLYLEAGDKVKAGHTEFVISFKNLEQ